MTPTTRHVEMVQLQGMIILDTQEARMNACWWSLAFCHGGVPWLCVCISLKEWNISVFLHNWSWGLWLPIPGKRCGEVHSLYWFMLEPFDDPFSWLAVLQCRSGLGRLVNSILHSWVHLQVIFLLSFLDVGMYQDLVLRGWWSTGGKPGQAIHVHVG